MEDIFESEYKVVLEAENLIQAKVFASAKDEDHYKNLLHSYKRLLRQMRTMVRMSDIMQSKLNTMSGELEKLSQTDALTGLYNRRFFNEIYQKEWQSATDRGTALGTMMIDIDYFKIYNDTFGHLAGDVCLQKIADSIAGTVKDNDAFVARFGGEEFILLMPDADLEKCTGIAQRIMDDLAALNIPGAIKTPDGKITVSIGIGMMSPTMDSKLETLVNMADQALYRAKKDGRNCWRI
ncbi:MAG: GGDEF domain-containing protein [Eubacteriales bacterium]|nr:GGDEF domain-containing protein [Eubacteriales bacterium]